MINLPRQAFAEAAQKAGTKALLSVGGWSGSALFSGLVAKEDTRKAFVDAMVKAMEDSSFDGIDIDWEYPGKAGATEDVRSPCSPVSYSVRQRECC